MRRSLLARAGTAVLAVWFSLVSAAPPSFHACPANSAEHGAHVHGAMAGNATAMAGMDMSGMDMASGAPMPSAPTPDSPSDHSPCTCPGTCCSSSLVGVVPTTVCAGAIVVVATCGMELPSVLHVPLTTPHSLPFANAPPVA